MKAAMIASVSAALLLGGCGTNWRFRDVSSEPLPREELRVSEPLLSCALCDVAYVASADPYDPTPKTDSDAELRRAAFAASRREHLANALLVSGLFERAEPLDNPSLRERPFVFVRLEERRGPPGYACWPHCMNGYAFAFLTGLWVPLLPVWIVQSHEYRACEPDLHVTYTLTVAAGDGTELARYDTEARFVIEEQQCGAPEPDPLLHDPHRKALDAAFERSLRVLLARLASDRGTRDRIERVLERR